MTRWGSPLNLITWPLRMSLAAGMTGVDSDGRVCVKKGLRVGNGCWQCQAARRTRVSISTLALGGSGFRHCALLNETTHPGAGSLDKGQRAPHRRRGESHDEAG